MLEPRQVIDTRKTNWTLYFAKRNLFLKNCRSLYIHVSFGYRNQRDIPKIIKDNIIYCTLTPYIEDIRGQWLFTVIVYL